MAELPLALDEEVLKNYCDSRQGCLWSMHNLLEDKHTSDQERVDALKFLLECCRLALKNDSSSVRRNLFSFELLMIILSHVKDQKNFDVKSVAMDVLLVFPLGAIARLCKKDDTVDYFSDDANAPVKVNVAKSIFDASFSELFFSTAPGSGISIKIYWFLDPLLRQFPNGDGDIIPEFYRAVEMVMAHAFKDTKKTRDWKEMDLDMESAENWSYTLRLITSTVRLSVVRKTVKSPGFLKKLVSLVRSRHVFLRLDVIKLVRELIREIQTQFYFELIERDNLLAPILEIYMADHSNRNNIPESLVRNLFQSILDLDDRNLVQKYADYVIGTFGELLRTCRCLPYLSLKSRHDSAHAQATALAELQQDPDYLSDAGDSDGEVNICHFYKSAFPQIRDNSIKDVEISCDNDNSSSDHDEDEDSDAEWEWYY